MSPEQFADWHADGLLVLKGLLTSQQVYECANEWMRLREDRSVGWNPVEVNLPHESYIHDLATAGNLGAPAAAALGATDELAVYNVRLVVKDKHALAPVFLHQDVGYHVGSLPKLSAFVALSSVFPENGAMRFWLGTHRFGYLGDVGEIDPAAHPGEPRIVCPVLAPGDVVLMHSALWHDSGPNTCGVDRVMADIIYQRADDPSRAIKRDGIFKRSRSSRLKELQAQVDSKGPSIAFNREDQQ